MIGMRGFIVALVGLAAPAVWADARAVDPHAGHRGHVAAVDPHAGHHGHDGHHSGDHDHPVDHDGPTLHGHGHHGSGNGLTMSLALSTATYNATHYSGDYTGVTPEVMYMRGRWSAMATIAGYRLFANDTTARHGVGDTMVGAAYTVVQRTNMQLGLHVMAMIPTGDRLLGMGHFMGMPSVFASYHAHPVVVVGSVGPSFALGGDGDHASHSGPIVAPMNQYELTWDAGLDLMVDAAGQRMIGARISGGAPIGDGTNRVFGGLRAQLGGDTMSYVLEVQAGLDGDPFTVRGIVKGVVAL